MKKNVIKLLILAGFFFMIGFFKTYHLPDIKLWTINKIDLITRSHGPVHIQVSDIDFTGYPLGIEFNKLKIIPKNEAAEYFETIYLKSLRFTINPLSFLTGLFQLSKIEFIEPNVTIKKNSKIKELFTKKSDSTFSISLKKILRIPLTNLTVRNMNFFIPDIEGIPSVHLNHFSFDLENQRNSILFSVYAPSISVLDKSISETPAVISTGMRMLIFDDQIILSALKVEKDKSYLIASGFLDSDLNKIQLEQYQLKIKSNIDLNNFKKHIQPFFSSEKTKHIHLPEASGRLQSLFTLTKKLQTPEDIEVKFKTTDLKINKFSIGNAIGKLNIQNGSILSKKIEIQNSAGNLEIKNLNYDYKNTNSYEVELKTESLQLQKVLENIGLGTIPVLLEVQTHIPCKGNLKSKDYLNCNGSIALKNLKVYNETQDIVTAKSAVLTGNVQVNDTDVLARAKISLGMNSNGYSEAVINYNNGFQISYESEKLDFSDLSISTLDLLGTSRVKGTTSGNSSKAVFDMNLKTLDSEIYKYQLGDFSTHLSYKKGKLYLENIDGLIGATKYVGDIAIDLRESKIKGFVHSPYVELSDLTKAFSKIVTLPFDIYGGGEIKTSFLGPLDFSKMSYVLSSQFINGTVANESFDKIIFNVNSKEGHVSTKQASLKKGSGVLTLNATAEPSGQHKSNWKGENFTLQQINSFAKTELAMNGRFDFDLNLTGHILHPESIMKGTVSNATISQEQVSSSDFELQFTKKYIKGSATIFGNQILTQFKIPFTEEEPLNLNAKIRDWDFSPLIHLISSKSRASEYNTKLSGDVDLNSTSNFLWNSTGTIHIQDLQIQRGTKNLALAEPTSIHLNSGLLSAGKFLISGDNTSLEIRANPQKEYPIFLDINGKLDLSVFSFLTPFFEDLRGTAALTTQFKLNKNKWSLFGSAFLTNGYIRAPNFPHAIENMDADLLFSDDKININKLTAQFASGKATANGQIQINGSQDIPVNLYGKFQDVQLQIPKDISTKGTGDFRIKGNWFPYIMEGNYLIQGGLITKEFTEESSVGASFQRNQLLPKELLKEVQEIVLFDYDIIFSKGLDIKNEFIDSKIYGKLKIKGPPSSPTLLGGIQLQRNSKIYFKDTEFEVETGELKFTDKTKINPDLYISARANLTETIDTTSQRYEINMLIQGKSNNPTINLSSNPPRSEKDIISLLALGVTTESYQTNTDQNQITKQSYEVGASILTKNKFGRDLKQKTGFEFKVSSALDQTTNTTAPKITISKQWTPRIETSASRTFGQSTTNDLKVEYQLNKSISLIGSWEGREISNTNTNSDSTEKTTTDILGLDIEYKLEFK